MVSIDEITVLELKELIDGEEEFTLIDVREEDEREISKIEGSIHIPLDILESRLDELDKEKTYVVHCKMGGRSAKACQIMEDEGFKNVKNLTGGITQWALEIDPDMAMY